MASAAFATRQNHRAEELTKRPWTGLSRESFAAMETLAIALFESYQTAEVRRVPAYQPLCWTQSSPARRDEWRRVAYGMIDRRGD